VVAGVAYGALRWYPTRTARTLMRPTSADYARALGSYRSAEGSLPAGGTDAQTVVDAAQRVLAEADRARNDIAAAQLDLEGRSAPEIPVISSRSPLDEAIELRERILKFYTEALQAIGDLQSLAGYLSEISGTLAQLDDLEREIAKAEPQEAASAVEAAVPTATQLAGDLEALTPPEELGSLHASLQAIVDQITSDLDQLQRTGRQAAEPIVRALLDDILAEVDSFRGTIAGAPDAALGAGLGKVLNRVQGIVGRIADGLKELRDQGVTGLTVPGSSP
jgi:hypothetical protein